MQRSSNRSASSLLNEYRWLFTGSEGLECKSDHLLSFSVVTMRVAIPPLSHMISWHAKDFILNNMKNIIFILKTYVIYSYWEEDILEIVADSLNFPHIIYGFYNHRSLMDVNTGNSAEINLEKVSLYEYI
jgi:hypothetical protein